MDCPGFLLRNLNSGSEEVTRLMELGEGHHLCLSEARNPSRLQSTNYDDEWVLQCRLMYFTM